MKHRIALTLVALLALGAHIAARGADDPAPAKDQPAASRTLPFYGKLVEVDTKARTFTVGKRVFHLSQETRVTKDGAAATLMDGVVGERVRGAYVKLPDGTLRATLVRFGNPSVNDGPAEKPPAKREPSAEDDRRPE